MPETLVLQAEIREANGKGGARAIRREGKVPAIIYGKGKEEIGVSLDRIELVKFYKKGGFSSRVVELKTDKKTIKVIPRALQFHPVNDLPLHVDFMFVEDSSIVNVMVKVNFINAEKSPGLKRGGVLNIVRRKIELLCEASKIPDSVTADLSGYQIGASVHVSAIALPEGAKLTIDRDFTIAAITGRGVKKAGDGDDSDGAE